MLAGHRLKEKLATGYKNESHGMLAGNLLTEKAATAGSKFKCWCDTGDFCLSFDVGVFSGPCITNKRE